MKIPPFLLLERYESLVEVLAHNRTREIVCSEGRYCLFERAGKGPHLLLVQVSVAQMVHIYINWIAGIESFSMPSSPAPSIMAAAR